MLTISGKTLARKQALFADFSMPFPPDLNAAGDRLMLRDLITRIVRREVAEFRQRQEERVLHRALTARQIDAGAERGKIDSGGQKLDQNVDEDAAVAAALEAFEDGLYLVVVDDAEQKDLN